MVRIRAQGIQDLPNELLTDIAGLLDTKGACTTFMLVSRKLSFIGAKRRYHTLRLAGDKALRCLTMLISSTRLAKEYCAQVRSLTFQRHSQNKLAVSAIVLAQALLRMELLADLALDLEPEDVEQFMAYFERCGLLRKTGNLGNIAADVAAGKSPVSVFSLPRLRCLWLHTSTDILKLASWRNLDTLVVSDALTPGDIGILFAAASAGGFGSTVTTLCLTVNEDVTLKTVFMLFSSTFTSVRQLAIEQFRIQALDLLLALIDFTFILPNLREVSINADWNDALHFMKTEQRSHVFDLAGAVFTVRPFMEKLGIGSKLWMMSPYGNGVPDAEATSLQRWIDRYGVVDRFHIQ